MKFRADIDLIDPSLKEHLKAASFQIEELYKVEANYLTLKAARDVKWSHLFLEAAGSSVEQKKAWVNAHEEWNKFSKALAVAEADFHKQKHRYELNLKYIDAAHLSLKVEKLAIERGVS